MRLVINNVGDAESPLEYSPWVLVSFNSRHGNYDKDFDPRGAGIRQKVKGATAFLLDYFEHGQCIWSLRGEGVQDRWDTSRGAGVILGNYKELKHLSHDERRQDARAMMRRYTDWCNGNIYEYVFVPEHTCSQCSHTKLDWGDTDWSGTWYDTDDMFAHIQTEMKREEYKVDKISGGAAWLADHHKLEGAGR
jgi:hypothetical protein